MYTGDKSELKVWSPADEDELTPSVIFQTACDIREGKADPEQARRLLRYFIDWTEEGRPLPGPLLELFRDAFTKYLTDPLPGKLERLLGLTLGRGEPIDRETARRHHVIAWEVLQRRLEGRTLSDAGLEASYEVGRALDALAYVRRPGFQGVGQHGGVESCHRGQAIGQRLRLRPIRARGVAR